jgi:hypothetical protein
LLIMLSVKEKYCANDTVLAGICWTIYPPGMGPDILEVIGPQCKSQ